MKFIIALFLVLCGSQLSLQSPCKAKPVYLCFDAAVTNATILNDTWFKGVGPNQHKWFDTIEFVKDISINNSLQLDYEYKEKVVNSTSGEIELRPDFSASHDFCYMDGASYIPIIFIRKLLGLTEGCPIAAGEKKNTTDVRPFFAHECSDPKPEDPQYILEINVKDYDTKSLLLKAVFNTYGELVVLPVHMRLEGI